MTVIAMTREIGSLGTDVAAGLASELGLKIIDSEIVANNAAGSLGVEQSTVQRYLDGSASMFERWQINKRKLSRYTSEQILGLAQQGNVLIRGWGAAALFRGIPQVISVRVCAPMVFRERILKERLGDKDTDAIRDEIERYDEVHASTTRASFNIDREDPLLYHIVLNTGRVPVDVCVKTVCLLARDSRFQDDAAMRSALTDKLLEMQGPSQMSDIERTAQFLRKFDEQAYCDDCLTILVGFPGPAEANQATTALGQTDGFTRERAECSLCHEDKLTICVD